MKAIVRNIPTKQINLEVLFSPVAGLLVLDSLETLRLRFVVVSRGSSFACLRSVFNSPAAAQSLDMVFFLVFCVDKAATLSESEDLEIDSGLSLELVGSSRSAVPNFRLRAFRLAKLAGIFSKK